jgi:hypothetical protein
MARTAPFALGGLALLAFIAGLRADPQSVFLRRYPEPAGQIRPVGCFGYFGTLWQPWQVACPFPDGATAGPPQPLQGNVLPPPVPMPPPAPALVPGTVPLLPGPARPMNH